jgi:colanic acid/amylovoran biosynthesis glycosyltransferase
MLTIAYLANEFPSPVEPYVTEEIAELRSRGVPVIATSARRVARKNESPRADSVPEVISLYPLRVFVLLRALWLCLVRWRQISDLACRICFRGTESPLRRLKAISHTWLGACYAVILRDCEVGHIHVHHGYFASWIAMVAARLLGVSFSMTLHGSDLLMHAAYLDTKLTNCNFCATISEHNRRYILERYPNVDPERVVVSRLGVELPLASSVRASATKTVPQEASALALLSVGRLHAVKDHAFLLRALRQLRVRGIAFECSIAGEGPERRKLERLIRKYGLEQHVTLLGHVSREQMDSLYDRADVIALTSRSEGIPLVLMEAMAREKLVLAPAITGIPELVKPGKTGFLYEPGSLGDFLARLLFIHSFLQTQELADRGGFALSAARSLDWVRFGARVQVRHNFNRQKNLESFGDLLIQRVAAPAVTYSHENLVLQQI